MSGREERGARGTYLTGDSLDGSEDHEDYGDKGHDRAADDGLDLGPGKVGGDPCKVEGKISNDGVAKSGPKAGPMRIVWAWG